MDASGVLRQGLLQLAASGTVRDLVEKAPVSRSLVRRYVAGSGPEEAVGSARELVDTGRLGTVDYLGEDTVDLAQAQRTRDAYLAILHALSGQGLARGGRVELSVKVSAIGGALPGEGHKVALEHAREICQAAANAGTTVTLDAEDHASTDATLTALRELRQDFPWVGAVLQAYLYRTESDCRALADEGSRVRLCKGAYREPESVAFQRRSEVDRSYVRCLRILMEGDGYPMVATHDPRLVEIARALAVRTRREPDSFEYQMLYGIRPDEQRRIAERGDRMRVYLPYGEEWYGYLMRRMAEKPANLMVFLRSLTSKG
ncbi:MAG TPA: proline dehydrogenase family protein [Segeticoccus sp.]|nr:proline dehydrogenase family protein [Segeticoccus sp.]